MTPKLTLFFLVKNYENQKILLAERLKMPRSTIYAVINHTLHSIKSETATRIYLLAEQLRDEPTLRDVSLLLPTRIPKRWRFATRDATNTWILYDSEYPPAYGQLGWAVSNYTNTPQLTLNPTLFRIPADREDYSDHLYQRDQLTGLWFKTNSPTAVELQERSQYPTQADFDDFADKYLVHTYVEPQDKLSNMLENNPHIKL